MKQIERASSRGRWSSQLSGNRILVTGGAGFIGTHLVRKLVDEGCQVIILDNFSSATATESCCNIPPKARVIEGDVREYDVVRSALTGVDAVVHLAALTSVEFSVNSPAITHEVNATGTLNVIRACVDMNVKKFVLASSCAVYGNPNEVPIGEGHPTNPLSPYAASKLSAEAYCKAFANSFRLGSVILRLFNVYGPGQSRSEYSGVISRFRETLSAGRKPTIYGDGWQSRDFIHVNDVVEAFKCSLGADIVAGDVYNIGTGRSTSIIELLSKIQALMGKKIMPRYLASREGEVRDSRAETGKALRRLGFHASINLNEGLRRLMSEQLTRVSQ